MILWDLFDMIKYGNRMYDTVYNIWNRKWSYVNDVRVQRTNNSGWTDQLKTLVTFVQEF